MRVSHQSGIHLTKLSERKSVKIMLTAVGCFLGMVTGSFYLQAGSISDGIGTPHSLVEWTLLSPEEVESTIGWGDPRGDNPRIQFHINPFLGKVHYSHEKRTEIWTRSLQASQATGHLSANTYTKKIMRHSFNESKMKTEKDLPTSTSYQRWLNRMESFQPCGKTKGEGSSRKNGTNSCITHR